MPNIGKLECRPVLPGETALVLPPEVTEDRIGYVAVQFNQKLDQVQLLGFSPAIASLEPPEKIQVAELQSLDALIDNLTLPVKLRQWLEGVFSEDWRSPNLVLSNWRKRKTTNYVSRAKIIDLARQEAPQAVVMLVQLTPTASEKVDILVRLYPGGDSIHLPLNLQLFVLDEAGTACMEAIARSTDNWMQLEFSCTHEEGFSVKVVLGEMSITQQFVV